MAVPYALLPVPSRSSGLRADKAARDCLVTLSCNRVLDQTDAFECRKDLSMKIRRGPIVWICVGPGAVLPQAWEARVDLETTIEVWFFGEW